MIFTIQSVNLNANMRVNFSAIFICDFDTAAQFCSVIRFRSDTMYGTTQRQRRKADAILICRRCRRNDESVIFISGVAVAVQRNNAAAR